MLTGRCWLDTGFFQYDGLLEYFGIFDNLAESTEGQHRVYRIRLCDIDSALALSQSVLHITDFLGMYQAELARVLRPGAPLMVTFSDRWFASKAIRIWSQLHEFERMGLVTEYFRNSGGFTALETISVRGLPRPVDDKYFPQRITADPVFAVMGTKDGSSWS